MKSLNSYVVQTGFGDFETQARSRQKAINNVSFRLMQKGVSWFDLHVERWTVIEK